MISDYVASLNFSHYAQCLFTFLYKRLNRNTIMDVIFISRKYYMNILRRNHTKIYKPCQSNYSALSSSPDNPLLSNKLDAVKSKVYDFMKWYEQLTGIDEIRIAQNKVIEAQDRFAAAQEKRREVTLELNDVKNKIKDLQEELSSTSRGEERFVGVFSLW